MKNVSQSYSHANKPIPPPKDIPLEQIDFIDPPIDRRHRNGTETSEMILVLPRFHREISFPVREKIVQEKRDGKFLKSISFLREKNAREKRVDPRIERRNGLFSQPPTRLPGESLLENGLPKFNATKNKSKSLFDCDTVSSDDMPRSPSMSSISDAETSFTQIEHNSTAKDGIHSKGFDSNDYDLIDSDSDEDNSFAQFQQKRTKNISRKRTTANKSTAKKSNSKRKKNEKTVPKLLIKMQNGKLPVIEDCVNGSDIADMDSNQILNGLTSDTDSGNFVVTSNLKYSAIAYK